MVLHARFPLKLSYDSEASVTMTTMTQNLPGWIKVCFLSLALPLRMCVCVWGGEMVVVFGSGSTL